jgi:hypothetical protein
MNVPRLFKPGCTALALIAFLLSPCSQAATTIDIGPFIGQVGTRSDFGQTFVAPVDRFLTSYTFYLDANEQEPTAFQTYIFKFDAATSKVVGDPIFTSDVRTVAVFHPQMFTYSVPLVQLATGQNYLAVVRQNGMGNDANIGNLESPAQAGLDHDLYPQGSGKVIIPTWPFPYAGNSWGNLIANGADIRFTATFATSVPEPTLTPLFIAATIFVACRPSRSSCS